MQEVILLTNLPKKGKIGELIKVTPGFARNYLLPRGLALLANKNNKAQLAHQMRAVEKAKAQMVAGAQKDAERISKMTLTFARRVGEQGKLFGSVSALDVHRALQEAGVEVDKHNVLLEEAIHQLGPASAEIKLPHEVRAKVNLMVVMEA